jgi:hypothetical protein
MCGREAMRYDLVPHSTQRSVTPIPSHWLVSTDKENSSQSSTAETEIVFMPDLSRTQRIVWGVTATGSSLLLLLYLRDWWNGRPVHTTVALLIASVFLWSLSGAMAARQRWTTILIATASGLTLLLYLWYWWDERPVHTPMAMVILGVLLMSLSGVFTRRPNWADILLSVTGCGFIVCALVTYAGPSMV